MHHGERYQLHEVVRHRRRVTVQARATRSQEKKLNSIKYLRKSIGTTKPKRRVWTAKERPSRKYPRAAQELLPDLKKELGDLAEGVDDDQLLKFLYWKQDVNRAAGRYKDFIKWKTSNPGLFDETLQLTKDPELERVVAGEILVSPPKLLTKKGETILIARMRNNDMTDGRTVDTLIRSLFYNIDAVLDRPETQLKGVVVIHDLRGVDKRKNFRMEIAKRLYHGLFGQFAVHINVRNYNRIQYNTNAKV